MEFKSRKGYFTGQIVLLTFVVFITSHSCNSFCLPGMEFSSTSTLQNLKNSADAINRLCPEGSAFHNGTSTCHKLLEKGPCGDLQLFYALSKDSVYGACSCMSNDNGCNPIVKTDRMILPGPDGKQCFWAYSSGPCTDGQWYVLNMKSLKPECQKNACYSDDGLPKSDRLVGANIFAFEPGQGETDKFTFVHNNTCYKTYTQAFCPSGQYVQFLGTNDPYPKCYGVAKGPPLCLFGFAPVVGMPCQAGYKLVGDDCVPANIDFE